MMSGSVSTRPQSPESNRSGKTLTLTSPTLDGRPRFLLVSSRAGVSLSDMMPGTDTVLHTQARGYKPKQPS
jgi:hypothetical protein